MAQPRPLDPIPPGPWDVVVVGGGYIAVEFAGIFNGLGAQTTQLYRGPLFLRGFDHDIRKFAASEIAKSGVDLQFNKNITAIELQQLAKKYYNATDFFEIQVV